MKLTAQQQWQDEVRLLMIDKSEFYQHPNIYQYGYYDGYQIQNRKIENAIDLIQTARLADHSKVDAMLQDVILTLLKPLPCDKQDIIL